MSREITRAASVIADGGVIAYPSEAVWGLVVILLGRQRSIKFSK